jgi:hypothetical protein
MAQQTAVDWFEKNYHELLVEASINNMHVVLFDKKRGELFQQAKAMEKEQIVDAHLFGLLRPLEMEATKQAEQYYNETYDRAADTK